MRKPSDGALRIVNSMHVLIKGSAMLLLKSMEVLDTIEKLNFQCTPDEFARESGYNLDISRQKLAHVGRFLIFFIVCVFSSFIYVFVVEK